MPELPEVEITARKLRPLLLGKRLLGFWTDWPKSVRAAKPSAISRDVKNRKIETIERRGKAVLMRLSGDRMLAFHQKMSGKILVLPREFKDKHIHHRFALLGGKELVLHDTRKFGRIWYGKKADVLADAFFSKLGSDALELSAAEFRQILFRHKGTIKPLLLRQDVLAGIGNIVADESLWKARVHPQNKIANLDAATQTRLLQAIRFVLRKSIALGGSSMRDWLHPDRSPGGYYPRRYIYGRADEPCPRCKAPVRKIIVASRGTHFCPKCQRLPRTKRS